jgi:hypothetical protein
MFLIAKGIRGRGELRFNFQFRTQPLVHILCTSCVLIAYRRGLWFQRGFVTPFAVRGCTENISSWWYIGIARVGGIG